MAETEATVAAQPVPAPATTSSANTSGQGSAAVVPEEVKGWSWGGFWLSWIWGIGNNVWIALLALVPVPFLAIIMMFVLGAKGREWAWQNKHWDSVAAFNQTQKTWGMVGLILAIIGIVLAVLWFILIGAVVISAIMHGATTTTTTY
jgi:hypothetical protein